MKKDRYNLHCTSIDGKRIVYYDVKKLDVQPTIEYMAANFRPSVIFIHNASKSVYGENYKAFYVGHYSVRWKNYTVFGQRSSTFL